MISSHYEAKDNTVTIAVNGRFDFSCQKDFREAFVGQPSSAQYIINLTQVNYIDSSALGMLLLLRDYAGGEKSKVYLRGANAFVDEALRMARFDRLFYMGLAK